MRMRLNMLTRQCRNKLTASIYYPRNLLFEFILCNSFVIGASMMGKLSLPVIIFVFISVLLFREWNIFVWFIFVFTSYVARQNDKRSFFQ